MVGLGNNFLKKLVPKGNFHSFVINYHYLKEDKKQEQTKKQKDAGGWVFRTIEAKT